MTGPIYIAKNYISVGANGIASFDGVLAERQSSSDAGEQTCEEQNQQSEIETSQKDPDFVTTPIVVVHIPPSWMPEFQVLIAKTESGELVHPESRVYISMRQDSSLQINSMNTNNILNFVYLFWR